jgi:type VI secretion system protein ImpK
MSGKDPFGDDDIDATVMRPPAFQRPGAPGASAPLGSPPSGSSPLGPPPLGPSPLNQPPPPRPAASAPPPLPETPLPGFAAIDEATLAALTGHGQNPLLSAAAPLLALVTRLRDLTTHRDVESLRERVIAELRRFETTAIQAGVTTDQVRVGRYALCATVDDVVLNTPWGGQSVWAAKSMVTTIHKEAWGGERFFDLLEQMQAETKRYLAELELFYACLSLGFEGRYRVSPRGHSELARLRDGLYRALRRERGDVDRELSPQWRGVADRYRPLRAVAPLWVIGAVAAALLMFLYMALAYSLSGKTDEVYQKLAGLLPNRPVEIARLSAPPAPAVRPDVGAYQRIAQALAADVQAGKIAVLDEGDGGVLVRTRAEVFLSGSDSIEPTFAAVIDRAGQALAAENGPVQVIGHTDSQPIRTLRFPSNQELSEARAQAVMKRLSTTMGGAQRLTAEGRGAREPIASNDSVDGRRQNRRIDILLSAQ